MPNLPSDSSTFYNLVNAIWPDLKDGKAIIAPPRNGMDRFTGQMLSGWDHVDQSMGLIFATPFHQRVLRRWVGSFVPHILGESAVSRVITRFFWAIATAIDLWEPDYRITQTYLMGSAVNGFSPQDQLATSNVDTLLRQGQVIFRTEGVYYPRGHLGDYTPLDRRTADLTKPFVVPSNPVGPTVWPIMATLAVGTTLGAKPYRLSQIGALLDSLTGLDANTIQNVQLVSRWMIDPALTAHASSPFSGTLWPLSAHFVAEVTNMIVAQMTSQLNVQLFADPALETKAALQIKANMLMAIQSAFDTATTNQTSQFGSQLAIGARLAADTTPPSVISTTPVVTAQSQTVALPAAGGTSVATMSATHSPTSWDITAGNPNSAFVIDNSGNVSVATGLGTAPAGTHNLTIQATNASGSGTASLTLTCSMPAPEQAGLSSIYPTTNLILLEQFTGTSLNTTTWLANMGDSQYGVWADGGKLPSPYSAVTNDGPGQLNIEFGDPAQISVNYGLKLSAVLSSRFAGQTNGTQNYTWASGYLRTKNQSLFVGGYVQVLAKMPDCSTGMWPGIWFMNGGTGGAEIDLIEGGYSQYGTPNSTMASNVHTGSNPQDVVDTGKDLSAGYHIYGMEYIPGVSLKMYLDGVLIATYTNTIPTGAYELLLTLQVFNTTTTGWHSNSSGSTPSPSEWDIAEVQVYKTSAMASAPIVSAQSQTVALPALGGATVATMSATNTPTSWTITAGNPNSSFVIDNSGNVTVAASLGTAPAGTHSLTIQATNTAGSGTATLTLTCSMPAPSQAGLTNTYPLSNMTLQEQFLGTVLNSSVWLTNMGDSQYGVWRDTGKLPSPYSAVQNDGSGQLNIEFGDPAQISVNYGLKLTAVRSSKWASQTNGTQNYTWAAGYVRSSNASLFAGGYVQILAKMPPCDSGFWNSLWFLNGGGEIDLVEVGYSAHSTPARNMACNLHTGSNKQQIVDTGKDLSAGYHIYGMEYIPGVSLKMYFDGVLIATYTNTIPTGAYELLMTFQVAGSNTSGWHAVASGSTPSPGEWDIAEIQVYHT